MIDLSSLKSVADLQKAQLSDFDINDNNDLFYCSSKTKEKTISAVKAAFITFNERSDWEKCQKTLSNYSDLNSPFETWFCKISLTDKANSGNWSDIIKKTHASFRNLLISLFRIEEVNPQLFKRILSATVRSDSPIILRSLINILRDQSYSNVIALLQQIELHPDLIRIIEDSSVTLHFDFFQFDKETQYVILKEKDSLKRSDIQHTFCVDPKKIKKLFEIDNPVNTIWKRGEPNGLYYYIGSELVDQLYKVSSDIKGKIRNLQQKINIPWDQIPPEIFKIDPELPIEIIEFCIKLEIKEMNIRLLLEEAVIKGKQAKVYYLCKILPEFPLVINKEFFAFISELSLKDPLGKAFIILFSEDKELNDLEAFSFLNASIWTNFLNVVAELGKIYNVDSKGSINERLKALPIRWRGCLLRVLKMGLSDPKLIKPLCDFILLHRQLPFIEFFIILLNESPDNFDNFIDLFSKPYSKELLLSKFNLSNLIDICTYLWRKDRHSTALKDAFDKNPELLCHILNTSPSEDDLSFIRKTKDDILNMIKLDRQFGPPYGRIISNKFDGGETHNLIVSNHELATTVKEVGLNHFDLNHFKNLSNVYLYMLRVNPIHPGIKAILNNSSCTGALEGINWSAIRNPLRCVDHILTIAAWNEMDSLISILKWMSQHGTVHGEYLLDMAKAGYLPEAMAIIQGNNTTYLEQLILTDSAKEEKTKLIQEVDAKESIDLEMKLEFDKSLMQLKIRIEELKKQKFNDEIQMAHAIETTFAFVLADAMISSDGRLNLISFDRLLPIMDFPSDSDSAIYLKNVIGHLSKDKSFAEIIEKIKIAPSMTSPAARIVRRMFDLPELSSLNDRHAKVAALSAILSRPRQSNRIASCYASSILIISQSYKEGLRRSLEDYGCILENNCLTRIDCKETSYSYQVSVSPKKLNTLVLDENLLINAREGILASMCSFNTLGGGLIGINLMLFDDSRTGTYYRIIDNFNQEYLVVPTTLTKDILLSELRRNFLNLTKAVTEYAEPHPKTQNLGWWHLARRDKQQEIKSLESYQELHRDLICMTRKTMIQRFRDHEMYLAGLFDTLEKISQDSLFLKDIIVPGPKNEIDPEIYTLWMFEPGGVTVTVSRIEMQYVGNYLYDEFKIKAAEDALRHLVHYCISMPSRVKQNYVDEPERLLSISSPHHSFGFRPSALISHLQERKSYLDIIVDLNKPSGILMKDIDEDRKEIFFKKHKKWLPDFLRIPFERELEAIDYNKMTFEDFSLFIIRTFRGICGLDSNFEIEVMIENMLLELLTSEMSRKIPKLIIGDLNWHNGSYNNSYLAIAKNFLNGQLAFYITDRNGTHFSRLPNNVEGTWDIIQPIERIENGHLTYKKLAKETPSKVSAKKRKLES